MIGCDLCGYAKDCKQRESNLNHAGRVIAQRVELPNAYFIDISAHLPKDPERLAPG